MRHDVVVCVWWLTSQQQTFELSFSHHSPPLPPEHINDEIDETNIFVFGLQWVFVPEWLIYQVVSKASDAHSYIDEVAKFAYGTGTLVGVCSWVLMLFVWKNIWTSDVQRFGRMSPSERRDAEKQHPGYFTKKHFFLRFFAGICGTSLGMIFLSLCFFCYAALYYYVIWPIVPLFFNTFVFYFHIFMFIPFTVFGFIIGLLSMRLGPETFQSARYFHSSWITVSHYFFLLIVLHYPFRVVQDFFRRHFRS